MNQDCLIVIGGGILQLQAIKEAKSMGLKVAVVDKDENALGMKLADHPIKLDIKDSHQIIKHIENIKHLITLKGVMTAGTDASFTVATIAKHFDLKGITPETALNCTNKWKMRSTLQEHHIDMPKFFLVKSEEEAYDSFKKLNSPKAVIKPLDNMGARGVKQIFSPQEAYDSFRDSSFYSTNKEVIIEEYLEGPELSIDSLIFDDEFVPCGVADRIITREPYFIEIGHNLPSAVSQEEIYKALEILHQGAKALGINWGAAKGDIKMTPKGPRIVEIAARLSGGFMSAYTFPYASGVNLTKAAVLLAIGIKPDLKMLTPTENNISIERGILAHKKGVLKQIYNMEDTLKVPYIENIFITKPLGFKLQEITSNVDKIGHIIVKAPTLKDAEDAVKKAFSCIKVEIN